MFTNPSDDSPHVHNMETCGTGVRRVEYHSTIMAEQCAPGKLADAADRGRCASRSACRSWLDRSIDEARLGG